MAPAKISIKPLESYFIYCVHPVNGSCTFTVEQDAEENWISERCPPFINSKFIRWIGKEIENYGKRNER